MKICILILASIFCVAQSSFRSMEDHGKSFEVAKTHPAIGATLIVISEVDGDFSVSNGVYVAPGRALTHAHTRITQRSWVVSPFAGGRSLIYNLTLKGNSTGAIIQAFSLNIKQTLEKHTKACREVTEIRFPRERKLADQADALAAKLLLGTNAVDQTCEKYVAAAAVSPLAITGDDQHSVGPDFCILGFPSFDADHPVAEILSGPLPAEAVVTVLGTSFHTHLYNGEDWLFFNTISPIIKGLPATGRNTRSVNMVSETQFTCFSQIAREVGGGKLVVQAVCGSRASNAAGQEFIPDDELFDPTKTDSRIQALIVGGLSGAGVYHDGQLVGIVSHSNHNNFKGEFFARNKGLYEGLLKARGVAATALTKLIAQGKTLETVRHEAAKQLEECKEEGEDRRKKLENVEKLDIKIAQLEKDISELKTGADEVDVQIAKYDTHFSIMNMLLNIHQVVTQADIDSILSATPTSGEHNVAAAAATTSTDGGAGGAGGSMS